MAYTASKLLSANGISMKSPYPNATLSCKPACCVEGRDWQRHRKATAPPFGEPNMGLVWTECIPQATETLDFWKECSHIRQTGKDVRRFSLHVLSTTGFGKSYSFDRSTDEALREGDSLTYKDSLSLILENAILIMLLGPKFLTGSLQQFLPKHWRLVGQATSTFKKHISESIKEEKALIAEGKPHRGNFISAIGSQNLRGHDSIAITLTYVITHLAAYPEIQDWLAAEIRHVCKDKGATTYRDAFPKLKRCTAVVYETLRTSTPFPAMVKTSGPQPRSLKVGDDTLHLPAGMNIISTIPSVHPHPRYWGADIDTWRPERWIETSHEASAVAFVFDSGTLYTPPQGAFLPWSEGDRACPGKKFAQVELTGAVSVLVEPVPENGETMERARNRKMDMIKDSGMVLLIEILHPERVVLRWVKREARD
ncbi:Cytochrome P450 [Lachnellula subtilissima]|uniref:Cytochrome P450 n=1 Tax=Lachnellula subtilissima TaxID=602034 RepID=A0A8H8RIH1_9HELO|nr:Cytochrome P450 [Lachnellula subtilissima]